MAPTRAANLLLLTVAVVCLLQSTARADEQLARLLRRRQTEDEKERESTGASQQTSSPASPSQQQQAGRLYPDLPQPPRFIPQFNGPPLQPHHQHPGHQTPFVPFGMQLPAGREQAAPFGRVLAPPRPPTPVERLQSQSFADGLGRRLLSMIGISSEQHQHQQQANATAATTPTVEQEKVLQNSTLLKQLNTGVNSIYSNLAKMYNSTVQQQLDLLQERFAKQTANSTNPWQQQVAQEVPQFFQRLAAKVSSSQEQLNRVWRDLVAQANSSSNQTTQQQQQQQPNSLLRSFNDQFHSVFDPMFSGGNQPALQPQPQPQFFLQPQAQVAPVAPPGGQVDELAGQLRNFWHSNVQPQIGMLRNQVARVWRELTASGALASAPMGRQRTAADNSNASELIDSILKDVDMSSSEYVLVDSKADGGTEGAESNQQQQQQQQQQQAQPGNGTLTSRLSPQMQNGLIAMQRDLNYAWMGLSNSLQHALANVRNSINPRPQFVQLAMPPQQQQQQAKDKDPAESEIDSKIKDMGKLQRDADMVHDVIQQQQRETQQRQSIADRFNNFLNNLDFNRNVDQIQSQIGNSLGKFGDVVGDIWHQIPERWDNFMYQMRPQEMRSKLTATSASAPVSASTSTSTPTPTSATTEPTS